MAEPGPEVGFPVSTSQGLLSIELWVPDCSCVGNNVTRDLSAERIPEMDGERNVTRDPASAEYSS